MVGSVRSLLLSTCLGLGGALLSTSFDAGAQAQDGTIMTAPGRASTGADLFAVVEQCRSEAQAVRNAALDDNIAGNRAEAWAGLAERACAAGDYAQASKYLAVAERALNEQTLLLDDPNAGADGLSAAARGVRGDTVVPAEIDEDDDLDDDLDDAVQDAEEAGEDLEDEDVGGDIADEAEEVGDDAEDFGEDVAGEAENAGRDIAGEAENVGRDAEDVGRDVAEGAEDVGRDIGEGAEDVGRDIAEGGEDVGRDIADEAGDVADGARDAANDVF